jgi:hypothetical protein
MRAGVRLGVSGPRGPRMVGAFGVATALVGGALVAAPAQAVVGAVFTTDSAGQRVNQNQYADKCDVYINGGPNNGANDLSDGTYFFTVLSPGGQNDPNDGRPKVLYDGDDPFTNRTFTVSSGKIVGYEGDDRADKHASAPDGSTTSSDDDILIQLCQNPDDKSKNFADTTNTGGVYILAVCQLKPGATLPVDPRDCKYDAFKVRAGNEPPGGADLVAIKSADTSYTRDYTWAVDKSVDKTLVSQIGGTATFGYTVAATKSAPTDSRFAVTGKVTVFNPNSAEVTGVSVTDKTLERDCDVRGGDASIPPGGSVTFTYTCDVSGVANAQTAGLNIARVTWDATSIKSPTGGAEAEDAYDFREADVQLSGNSTQVEDTFDGVTGLLATPAGATTITESTTFTYPRSVTVPASNCRDFTNTAVVTQSGRSDSETVRACGPNTDGYTIGFWKNNSGKVITSANLAGYCTAINGYKNVLGSPKCTTLKEINAYISKTMSEGESSVDGVPMLRAQFLATVLNVQRTTALGSTKLLLQPAESAAVGSAGCAAVTQVLSGTNANYPAITSTKATTVLVKDVFDRVNNNRQLTC